MLLKNGIILGIAAMVSAQRCAGSTDGGTACSSLSDPVNNDSGGAAAVTTTTAPPPPQPPPSGLMLFKRDRYARELFKTRFPKGARAIKTSGEGQLCGIRALLASLEAQMPQLAPFPVEHEMQALAQYGDTAQSFNDLLALQGPESPLERIDSNYPADFLGGVLHEWGRAYKNVNLQLGVRRGEYGDSNDAFWIIHTGTEYAETLWVAHKHNHYEGLKPIPHKNW